MTSNKNDSVDWSEVSDVELARRYRDTFEERAFEELYRRMTPTVEKARRKFGRGLVFEDLKQEAVARLLGHLFTNAEPPSNCQGWLYKTLFNVAQEEQRRHRSAGVPTDPSDLDVLDKYEPATMLEERQILAKFERALGKLHPVQRRVLALQAEGLTVPEISNVLGIGQSTAYRHASAALRQFGEYVESTTGTPQTKKVEANAATKRPR